MNTLPRKVRPINKALKKLNLSAIEQEQIIRRNANSRPAYRKDWKSHKFTAAITWKPGDYENFQP